jgi:hypothetical protein
MFSPSVCSSFSIYHKNKFVAHFIQNLYSLVRNGREISFSDTFHEKIYREKSGVGISTTLLLTLGSRKTHFEWLRFSFLRPSASHHYPLSPFFIFLHQYSPQSILFYQFAGREHRYWERAHTYSDNQKKMHFFRMQFFALFTLLFNTQNVLLLLLWFQKFSLKSDYWYD